MKKKKILPVLIGILISISSFADDATQNAIYERLGQVLEEASQNRAINETHNSNFRSFVTEKFTPMANNIGSSMSYLNLINTIVQKMGTADGGSGTWFNTMYMLALDMQSKYKQLVSDLDDLYEHVSTTQNYQLEDIKTSNQTIRDNTTSIKDTTKNIETSTDVIEGHTETIASDTTEIKDLFGGTKTYKITITPPPAPNLWKPSLDFKFPGSGPSITTRSGDFVSALFDILHQQSWDVAKNVVVNQSANLNLQAIRTNLAEIAKHVTSNTTDKVTVDTLPDITADLLPEYGINVGTHDLPNVQENFTGDFHNDLLKLTRFNASVNISASYASISILTNLQSLLARNADLEEATQKESVQKGIEASQKELEGYEDDIESQQSTWAEYFRFKNENASKIMTQTPSFSSLTTDEMPQEISFTINDIKLSESSDTNHLMINHRLSAEEKDMLTVIRSCLTFFVWGVGVLASLWLYAMFIKLLGWACSLINPWAFETGSHNQLQLSSF